MITNKFRPAFPGPHFFWFCGHMTGVLCLCILACLSPDEFYECIDFFLFALARLSVNHSHSSLKYTLYSLYTVSTFF